MRLVLECSSVAIWWVELVIIIIVWGRAQRYRSAYHATTEMQRSICCSSSCPWQRRPHGTGMALSLQILILSSVVILSHGNDSNSYHNIKYGTHAMFLHTFTIHHQVILSH